MSLFNQILNAIDNPNQQASPNQLFSILNTVQQASKNSGTNPSMMESAMSVVGKYARSALQQKRNTMGDQQTQALVNQYSGTQPNNQAVNALFSSPQIQQIIQEICDRTGLNAGTVQGMLPILVPLVLNFLQTGASSQNPNSSNSVLKNFLDTDGDGDVDIADALRMASQYLKR